MVICLEQGAELHTAQLMPLPLTVSCFSKIQIGFTFLVAAYPGSPGQRAIKRARGCPSCRPTNSIKALKHPIISVEFFFTEFYRQYGLQTKSQCLRLDAVGFNEWLKSRLTGLLPLAPACLDSGAASEIGQ